MIGLRRTLSQPASQPASQLVSQPASQPASQVTMCAGISTVANVVLSSLSSAGPVKKITPICADEPARPSSSQRHLQVSTLTSVGHKWIHS